VLQVINGEPVAMVHTAMAEVGQGGVTVHAQIARTELGVTQVTIHPADTQVGSAGSTSASRQTYMTGGAVKNTCEAVREKVLEIGRRKNGSYHPAWATAELLLEGGKVVTDGGEQEVHRLDGTGPMGHIHLHDPSEDCPAGRAARLPVRLELTDIAPTPVRERLRARVTLTGLLDAPYESDASRSTCMEFGQALLEDADGRTFVALDELQATEPDPLAGCEAAMLTHLVDDHAELVPLLLRLVRPRPDRDMLRALHVG
ncbi:molybdopterin cofactor-binding domain-containing protein, partial [Streptomyces sp. WAC02707]|uniref:molybdopterin cofactor-binding domain-containing protein n=1 Tax=Streptomyces sp. WAC02707 TaxID=2487417 RepID=UPI0021AFFB18